MAQPSIDLCDSGYLAFIEEAGHWVLHEEPQRVNALVLEFLAEVAELSTAQQAI
jgi:pimeloyl-ACP methyl ester carboxylesterase